MEKTVLLYHVDSNAIKVYQRVCNIPIADQTDDVD